MACCCPPFFKVFVIVMTHLCSGALNWTVGGAQTISGSVPSITFAQTVITNRLRTDSKINRIMWASKTHKKSRNEMDVDDDDSVEDARITYKSCASALVHGLPADVTFDS